MKATVEIPDSLFRQAKATAALRGRKFKDLVEEGLRRVLEAQETSCQPNEHQPTVHDLMRECCGMIDSGVSDLATNPEFMKEFGRASLRHR